MQFPQFKRNMCSWTQNEHCDSPSCFDRLPDEMLEKIFTYLSTQDLCFAGRVCKRWFTVTRSPILWRRVDVLVPKLSPGYKFVEKLPQVATHLRMDFIKRLEIFPLGTESQNFPRLSEKLREYCPNLEVLIFKNISLQYAPENIATISDLLNNFPENLRVLVLEHCYFAKKDPMPEGDPSLSKIKVLDFFCSKNIEQTDALTVASMLPNLKRFGLSGTEFPDEPDGRFRAVISKLEVLDLENTEVGSRVFQTILEFGCYLKVLYMCYTSLKDSDFEFDNEDVLPNLEELCLLGTRVTSVGIKSLMKNCKSIQKVYWSQPDKSVLWYTQLPPYNRYFNCDHYGKTNYMTC